MKVAFCGKMASGKTTVSAMICELVPECEVLSFAAPIKSMAIQYFGMTGKDRELLIKIGQFGRDIDPDLWVKHLLREAEKHTYCVCDDLRQHNELKALRAQGWKLVRLDISPALQSKRLISKYGEEQAARHMRYAGDVSETEAVTLGDEYFDSVIDMDKYPTESELSTRVVALLVELMCAKLDSS